MRALATFLLIGLMASAVAAGPAEDYAAAVAAQQAGDCPAMLDHLDRFFAAVPDLRETHRSFYLQVRVVMEQCAGIAVVSGAGADSLAIDPLPPAPPDPG